VKLKPRKERGSAQEAVQQLRVQLARIPGMRSFPQVPPVIRIGGASSNSPYQLTLASVNLEALYQVGPQVEEKIRAVSGITDVSTDLLLNSPQVYVKIDRDKAAVLGITAQQIDSALYDSYGSREVSNIYTPADEYSVIIEVRPLFQETPERLTAIFFAVCHRRPCPAGRRGRYPSNDWTPDRQPFGSTTCGHALLQHASRSFTRGRRQPHRSRHREHCAGRR